MKTRLIALALAAVLAGTLHASTADAEARLRTAVNEVLVAAQRSTTSRELPDRIGPILLRNISFETMTRRAVGPGWRGFTDDQKRQAIKLFGSLIVRTYCDKITPGEFPDIKFKPAATPAPGRVEVPTRLTYQGSTYAVTYRLEEDDGWKITDVMIEGVSMVANYRTQFDAIFKKNGPGGILGALEKQETKKR